MLELFILLWNQAREDDAVMVSTVINVAFVEGDGWFKQKGQFLRYDQEGEAARIFIENPPRY